MDVKVGDHLESGAAPLPNLTGPPSTGGARYGRRPPYQVRWTEDGHEGLFFPGPDALVEHLSKGAKKRPK